MLDFSQPLPLPANEPILTYAPGTAERPALERALATLAGETPSIPHVIGGRPVYDGAAFEVRAPHRHRHVLANAQHASEPVVERAIGAALAAAPAWAATPFEERARIFLKAAELLAGPFRQTINAATMLGQSKSVYQAEIDAACEMADFFRFNAYFASRLAEQPISPPGVSNALELRPLEGFVLAVTPFNFTSIGGNLPTAPALMGNVVVWKPAETQSLSAYHTMRLLQAAGLPDGVINVVYGAGEPVGRTCLASRHLGGVHFTGSTGVFQHIWRSIGERIATYRTYPRIVGETGGKDFVFAHPSADPHALAVALVRGAFEYQGQKCSAASRAYIPASLWPEVKERVIALMKEISVGDVADFSVFFGAVIDKRSFDRLRGWLERLASDADAEVVAGGRSNDGEGYFVEPTLVRVTNPRHAVMQEELFGPVLSVYVYPENSIDEALELVNITSPYALTGAIFAQDRRALAHAANVLRQAAGNLYLNDKPTGAVVGQQPFGGARASGTNDKAGSAYNLLRWVSPRVIKETFVPATSLAYPHQTRVVKDGGL